MDKKNLISTVSDYFFEPTEMNNGIVNFRTPKFYFAMFCYLISIRFFMKDPFFSDEFGNFSYQQGGIILLTALIVMAALHWEMLLFGRPAGANLLLQVLSIAPFGLFLARILGESNLKINDKPWVQDVLAKGLKFFNENVAEISPPEWISEIFRYWECTLLLVLILLVLCLADSRIKFSALLLLLVVPFFIVLSRDKNLVYLLCGAFFMLVGLSLQFNNYAGNVYYLNILNVLRERQNIDTVYLRTAVRIMKKLKEEKKISENEVISIVDAEYGTLPEMTPQKIRLISSEILRSMMNEFNLLSLKLTHSGLVGVADGRLYRTNNVLTYIAVLPRVAAVMAITLICILSPVDLIPDIIPVVGMLDDISLSVVSFVITGSSLEQKYEK